MSTREALNSTVFLALARVGTPVLLATCIGMVGYWGNMIYERQELAFMSIGDLRVVVNGAHEARLTEIERRLNSRKSPINDMRAPFWGGGDQ